MLSRFTLSVFNGLFFIGVLTTVFSQEISPGGVEGETVWLKPYLVTENNFEYRDYSIFSQLVKLEKDNDYPMLGILNFNPTYIFSSSKESKDGLQVKKQTNLGHSTIIGVYQASNYGSDQNILKSQKDDSRYDFVLSSDSIKIEKKDIPVNKQGVQSEFSEGLDYGKTEGRDLIEDAASGFFSKPRILTYYRLKDFHSHNIWGLPKDPRTLQLPPSNQKNSKLNLKFGGSVPEFLTYDRMLTPKERLRVESYLAVKYGIHLTGNYTRSDDSILWSKTDDVDYHHRVTGIGRDDASHLEQNKSTSSYENPLGLLTIGQIDYLKDDDQGCVDCARYGLLNSNRVQLKDHTITQEAAVTNPRRSDIGGLLDLPLALGESITFQFNPEKNSSAFIGLSSKAPNRNWDVADYGIKKDNSNKLSWCKNGRCEDLDLEYTDQKITLKTALDKVILQLDEKEIKAEHSKPFPLLISFSLKEKGSSLERLQIHKNTLGRPLEDKEYYLWGDNNKDILNNVQSGIVGLTTINRIWKIRHTYQTQVSKPLLTKLELDYERFKSFFPEGEEDEYYLVIDQKGEGKFDESSRLKLHPLKIIPIEENKKIWALETIWDEDGSGTDAFTIGHSKSFLATVKVQDPSCSSPKGSLSVDIISGKQYTPIHYALYSGQNIEKEGDIEDAEESILIDDLSAGEYRLKLTNQQNKVSEQTVQLQLPSGIHLDIPKSVQLTHNGSITVDGSKGQPADLRYEWSGPSGYSHQGSKATLTQKGDYHLKAYVSPECYAEHTLTVLSSNIKDIKTYPIPLKLGEYLTVEALLYQPEEAQLVVYDMNGIIIYNNNREVTSTRHRFKLTFPRKDVYRAKLITTSSSEEFGITVN